LKHNTKVFEITEIYEPKIKLEKVKWIVNAVGN
jgi:hypothetical protein